MAYKCANTVIPCIVLWGREWVGTLIAEQHNMVTSRCILQHMYTGTNLPVTIQALQHKGQRAGSGLAASYSNDTMKETEY